MLCALCSIVPEMGITKGRRQNIRLRPYIIDRFLSACKKGAKTKGSDFLPWPPGFTGWQSQKAPHNVLWYPFVRSRNQYKIFRATSCSPLFTTINKYYTMHRCLSMPVRTPAIDRSERWRNATSVIPVTAVRFVRNVHCACLQFPLQAHRIHQPHPAFTDEAIVVLNKYFLTR